MKLGFRQTSIHLLTQLILKFWPLLLVGILALSAVSLPRTIRLFKTISTDPADLLPTSNPNVQTLQEARKKLEKGARASVIFESDDPVATRAFMANTTEQLRQHPLVGRVIDKKIGFDFFNRHKMMFLDLDDLETIRDRINRKIQSEKLKGLFIDLEDSGSGEFSFGDLEAKYRGRYSEESVSEYNVSPNGKVYSISVEAKSNNSGLQEASVFQDALEDFIKTLRPQDYHPTMKVYFAGPSKVLEYRALMKDLKRVGIISGILIFIPLLIRFRRPLDVAAIFMPLAIAMPISLAASSFFVAKFNVSTSFLFAILGGLGVENGIHIFSRYREDRLSGKTRDQSIRQVFEHTGTAVLTSVASVAVTFLLMMMNEFRGFSEFGLISGLGLWIIFAVYFLFLPSLLILLEKTKLLKIKGSMDVEPSFTVKPKWLKASLVVFALFSIFSVVAIPFLKFEYDSKKTRADLPEVRLAKEKQRSTTQRVNNPAVIVFHSEEEAQALRQAVELEAEQDKLSPTIDASRSYYDLVPRDQFQKLAVIEEIKKLLADKTLVLVKGESKKDIDRFRQALEESKLINPKEVPPELAEIFKGKPSVPGELFYINAIPNLELDHGKNAIDFADDIGTLKVGDKTYYPSSDAIVYGLVLKTMLNDAKTVLLVSLLSVSFFVFVDFRKWKKTLIVLTSIIVGVFWLLGVMLIFGIKFNFYNMIIIPAVMGMSIDNSIHIYHRYEELGRGSLARVLSTTGVSAMLASLTNASGFLGLLFCVHQGLYSIGLLAVIGVFTCLISTLVFLPALLQFLEHLRYDKHTIVP